MASYQVGNDADNRLGVVLIDIRISDYAHADAPCLVSMYGSRYIPAFPLLRPAEAVRRVLHRLGEEQGGTALPPPAVTPDEAVAGSNIVLLKYIQRIEVALLHGGAHQALQAAVKLLAAVASYDAGRLLIGNGNVAVHEPVGTFCQHKLGLAQAYAYLALYGVRDSAGIYQPVALYSSHIAFFIHTDLCGDGASQTNLIAHQLLFLGQHDLHRALGNQGQHGCGQNRGHKGLLVSVASAYVKGLYAQIGSGNSALTHQLKDVCTLGGCPDGIFISALILGDAAGSLRCQRSGHLVEGHLVLGYVFALRKTFLHITADDLPPGSVGLEVFDSVVNMIALKPGIELHSSLL